MLSHKWTFPLTSLVMLLAFCFSTSSAMAAEFSTTLSVDDSIDVSFADGAQVEYDAPRGFNETFTINVSFGKVVNHDLALAQDGNELASSRSSTRHLKGHVGAAGKATTTWAT